MRLPDERELSQYDRWGVDRPTHEEHGEVKPEDFVPFEATKWWMEGNVLKAEGNHGIVANFLPTDVICVGTDKDNKPILRKVVLQNPDKSAIK